MEPQGFKIASVADHSTDGKTMFLESILRSLPSALGNLWITTHVDAVIHIDDPGSLTARHQRRWSEIEKDPIGSRHPFLPQDA